MPKAQHNPAVSSVRIIIDAALHAIATSRRLGTALRPGRPERSLCAKSFTKAVRSSLAGGGQSMQRWLAIVYDVCSAQALYIPALLELLPKLLL